MRLMRRVGHIRIFIIWVNLIQQENSNIKSEYIQIIIIDGLLSDFRKILEIFEDLDM